LAGSTVRRRAG